MEPPQNQPKGKDAWDKAAIVSSLFSSVVIAAIGLLVTSSIQKTQIASTKVVADAQIQLAKESAVRENKLQESKLTADLLTHLLSDDAAHRQIAMIALRETVSSGLADSVLAVLAQRDSDKSVRAAAINQLRSSSDRTVAHTLGVIAQDQTLTSSERSLASEVGTTVAYNALVDKNTFLALALDGKSRFGGGTNSLTSTLTDIIAGKADVNHDGKTTVSELGSYLKLSINEKSNGAVRVNVASTLPPEDSVFTPAQIVYFILGDYINPSMITPLSTLQTSYRQPQSGSFL